MEETTQNKCSLYNAERFTDDNESTELNSGDNYNIQLYKTTQWLRKAGTTAKRDFLMGVLTRYRSLKTLENVQNVLKVALGKDFTYARSRFKREDMATHFDPVPPGESLRMEMTNAWKWFKSCPNWTQLNYLLGLLTLCDTELLHTLNNLINVLIWREKGVIQQLRTGIRTCLTLFLYFVLHGNRFF